MPVTFQPTLCTQNTFNSNQTGLRVNVIRGLLLSVPTMYSIKGNWGLDFLLTKFAATLYIELKVRIEGSCWALHLTD